MSLKRSHSGGKSFGGAGGDAGGKIDRQDLFDELKRLSGTTDPFTPVDVALGMGNRGRAGGPPAVFPQTAALLKDLMAAPAPR